jgi:hypothetical protein
MFASLLRFVSWVAHQIGCLLILVVSIPVMAQANVRFVDVNGNNTFGNSWPNAYTSLETAIDEAIGNSGITEIKVANGTYKPTFQWQSGQARSATFRMKSGLLIKGGFAGHGATDPDANDPIIYETFLSGDIGTPGTSTDNAWHVLRPVAGATESARLEGFTIRDGNASGPDAGGYETVGGGMLCIDASPAIRRCCFTTNSAAAQGGAIFMIRVNSDTVPRIRDCSFTTNQVTASGAAGGAIASMDNSAPIIVETSFHDNLSSHDGGGAVCFRSQAFFANCRFSDNDAGSGGEGGGALVAKHADSSGQPPVRFVNCQFNHNTASQGAAISTHDPTEVHLCTIADNTASNVGGAFFIDGLAETFLIGNSVLWDNQAGGTAAEIFHQSGHGTVIHSDVAAGIVTADPASGTSWTFTNNIEVDPTFVNQSQRNYRLFPTSDCIDWAGTQLAVPIDRGDLDEDGIDGIGDAGEPTPLDHDSHGRVVNTIVDMGAWEYQQCPADCDLPEGPNCIVNVNVLLQLLAEWDDGSNPPGGNCDVAAPPNVLNVNDLLALLAAWGWCPSCDEKSSEGPPDSVQDCLDMYEDPDDEALCIQRLCLAGQIPPEECQ